jgi:hypothetical protein
VRVVPELLDRSANENLDNSDRDVVQREYGDDEFQADHEAPFDVEHTYQQEQDGKFSHEGSWTIEDLDDVSNLGGG